MIVLNGPNLNMLGLREPEIYGTKTLKQIEAELAEHALQKGLNVTFFQSNSEVAMIDKIHEVFLQKYVGVIINPAAWTHSSIAIYDALSMLEIPIFEVHLSNIYKRESFRHFSYVSKISEAVISGLGEYGYFVALDAIHKKIV